MTPYRTSAAPPAEPLRWYVHAMQHPFLFGGCKFEVWGPYRWRWLARFIELTFVKDDYVWTFISDKADDSA